MKKIGLVLCIFVILCTFVTVISAEEVASGECGDNLTWVLDDEGTLTISGTGEMTSSPWSYINNAMIKSVVINDGVTKICEGAFGAHRSITNVVIPKSVTSIGLCAFENCSVQKVYISDISAWCNIYFENNTSNPLHLGAYLYLNNTLIKDFVIPNGVTSIGRYAFINCSNISNIIIPNSINSIGYKAFEGCSIQNVYVSDISTWCKIHFGDNSSNPLYLGANLYVNNTLVKDLVIPDSVTSIENYAFYHCKTLTNISLPNSITAIGDYAFFGCKNLSTITMSNMITSIGRNAFTACDLTNITIPVGVTSIDISTFSDCYNLSSITIPDSVTSINDEAFAYCSLKKIIIPKNVTYIDSTAFKLCNNLVIYGYVGSFAQDFAEINGIDFVHLDDIDAYTVSYNANGGDGAPEAQTKYEDITLNISATIPTLDDHIFKGWATTADGDVKYLPGDAYDTNESVVLYAVWEAEKADYVIGDANADSTLTVLDVIILIRHLAGWVGYETLPYTG